MTIRIPSRFNGPPASGHGGWSSGAVAELVDGVAAVSLLAPPPLDTDLQVRRLDDGSVEVLDGETLVARGEPADVVSEPPGPVTPQEAAAVTLDPDDFAAWHPFPTCFGCGPLRDDGLRLFAGPLGDGRFATDWTPAAEFAGADGLIPEIVVWAAMDCPSSAPVSDVPAEGASPIVLARLCIDLEAPVRAGEPHAIVSRCVRRDGRKRRTALALYDAGGQRLARGEALWIALRA